MLRSPSYNSFALGDEGDLSTVEKTKKIKAKKPDLSCDLTQL